MRPGVCFHQVEPLGGGSEGPQAPTWGLKGARHQEHSHTQRELGSRLSYNRKSGLAGWLGAVWMEWSVGSSADPESSNPAFHPFPEHVHLHHLV